MIYLLSEKRLKADFLNDNIASELILPSIQTAQDIFLRQTLGDSLLDKICNMIREDELEEPYKTLLDEYVIIYLEYLAMAELCVPSTFKIGNIGVAQAYDNNVNTQTIENVKYLESYYKQKASFYENRLTTFIQQHCNLFPEYYTVTDVTVSSESTLQCGIYLGGTTSKKRTIINNNSNNNNTEVGNYVRYDKAQNLSELEKAQARENIGVSANGEIDVDLENYYTKNEVDTLIDNIDIPDLNNYYTKSQVNKIVDDIPIPQYTSELELDNVYSKAQVDTLIGDINEFSGDYNDLSNKPNLANVAISGSYNDLFDKPNVYSKSEIDNIISGIGSGNNFSGSYNDLTDKPTIPTKTSELELDNVYSRNQVDTLINQIPTFSGNYEDLTNKPSIYTKEETDTLISNINTFDGDYNSLTNKPDVYTKSQTYNKEEIDDLVANSGSGGTTDLSNYYTKSETYSKSEIDLQFAEINTTLGNINNILNTI